MLEILKKRLKEIQNDNSGVAMVFAMIVGVVVMVFCLSLILVTYTLFAQINRQTVQLQNKMLAQSLSEALGGELSDEDSELIQYLTAEIASGKWISQEMAKAYEETEIPKDAFTDLTLDMEQDTVQGYTVEVTFTYNTNDSGDDPGDLDDDDDDDQDETDSENETKNKIYIERSTDGNTDGVSYNVVAHIKCMRGAGKGQDVQIYTIDTEYMGVTFATEEE